MAVVRVTEKNRMILKEQPSTYRFLDIKGAFGNMSLEPIKEEGSTKQAAGG